MVAGNYIGTNAAGTAALGNSGDGVEIDSGASSNTVGGSAAGMGNIISGNAGNGVFITGGNSNQIEGNFIGTNVTGTVALANADEGVEIAGGTGNTVGGAVAGAGNVISGNGQLGVWLYGNSSLNTSSNFVEGNLIGTNAMGMAVLGNGFGGIQMTDASANTIGGTTAAARNVISGNSDNGVTLESSSSNNLIEGNYIGTAADGVTALGNASAGVWINNASSNTIGGTAPGAGNIIANTTAGNGVTVVGSSTQDAIEGNSIYGDSGLGIDLGDDGVTPNGPASPRIGPNNLQNYPVLSNAVANGTSLAVAGTLNAGVSGNYEIDFYWSPVGNPSGYGEGKTYIGSTNVTTDALGNASFNTTFVGPPVPAGAVISATATDSSGNTSEFAKNFNVTYVNQTPTVATPAAATPSPVTGTTTALSVLGADDGGESNLTYTWATTGSLPAPVAFSANGTNAAKERTATFAAAGNYNFQVTITDSGGLSVTSSVSVTVNQTLSSIAIQPGPAAMADNTTYPFSATGLDQFGNPLASQPAFTWSVDNGGAGGTINSAGLYSTPASNTGSDTIRATSGSISTAVAVAVTGDGIFSGGYDVGPPTLPGSFSYNAGTYTLTGGYLNPTTDGFQFANGTFTGNATLVAQVTNFNGTATPAAAGVIFRDTTGDLSAYAGVVLGPGNQVTFYYRTSTGGPSQATTVSGVQAQWVEIVRNGNTFSGYYSANGVTWTQVGSSVTYADPSTILGGLVVSSLNASTLSTATFTNVASAVPAIATPAAALPNPVTGTSTGVSVLGAYDGGESNLTYTWSTTGTPPAAVIFADNGDNSAKNTTAAFTKAGVYDLLVTVSDGTQSVTSSVNVTVAQTLTSITVGARHGDLERERDSAVHRHGLRSVRQCPGYAAVLHLGLTSGIGSINATGLYTAPGNAGAATVTASQRRGQRQRLRHR